ncbi:DUF167 domain-containing protein [Roseomonas sp. OT10]|uniref:DUF167 domain-containing protein n=1 Tax=Roseomonas cutis TaxID=2897332 RepID=UPI001E35322D|nr:DUF167 domain-containing protein [Roseomonas sp. OT10]UFN48897.1 DUF167 domain-containing protein [Roseomonas sp. OT10]
MAGPELTAWRTRPEGLEVRVRAQPKAKRPGITGVVAGPDGPRLRVAVSAAPTDGKANAAVIAALSKALGVPPSAVTLTAGAAAREKTLVARGDPAALAAALESFA